MKTETFAIPNLNLTLVGQVILTEWPEEQGYSARLEDSTNSCPVAAGIGETRYAAIQNLTEQRLAQPYAADIMREFRKKPVLVN